MIRRFLSLTLVSVVLLSLNGCVPLLFAGAGAAGGYAAHKKGYRVQSPVEKENSGGGYDGY